jgi:hypothetical protein
VNHWAKFCVVLIGVGVSWGCSSDPTGPEVGEAFALAPGEAVTLELDGIGVRFMWVSEDSRCPLRAQCVWAGDAAVVIELTPQAGDAAEHTLHTNMGQKSIGLGRYELSLLELSPYPDEPRAISPKDYRATLVVQERLE